MDEDRYELERYWNRLRGKEAKKPKAPQPAPNPIPDGVRLDMGQPLFPYWPELPFPHIPAGWWVWVQLCHLAGSPVYVGDRIAAVVAPTDDFPRVSLRVVFPNTIRVGTQVNAVAVWEHEAPGSPTTFVMIMPRIVQAYEAVPVEISFSFQRLLTHAAEKAMQALGPVWASARKLRSQIK